LVITKFQKLPQKKLKWIQFCNTGKFFFNKKGFKWSLMIVVLENLTDTDSKARVEEILLA
jgi:hypothetical protein